MVNRPLVRVKHPNKELRDTAYHEAGHAVVAWACGVRLNAVTIVRDDSSLGHVEREHRPLSRTEYWDWSDWENFMYHDRMPRATPSIEEVEANRENEIMIRLAGPLIEEILGNEDDYADKDRAIIDWILKSHVTSSSSVGETYIKRLEARTVRIIEEHWNLIEMLAEELLRRQTLNWDDISRIGSKQPLNIVLKGR